ncbi:MAG: DUF512 domain-containing protein [Candidatus Gastranaerophilales bacterium]|nr:DUF512 domain-containing protein [Candidatus Gastranaerophilales bacterium]
MGAKIKQVENNTIAMDIGLKEGDEILAVNGETLLDYIQYEFLICSEEIELHIKKKNGEEEIIEIEKDFDDTLGVVFESAVFDKIKPCANKCIFCFVDQQPEGLRKTLYIKDDDYRLSYLQGTYVTLTNLTKNDIERIEKLRLGPLFVSVHTTNPELRIKMLQNKRAGDILDRLKWLNNLEIPFHTQIVLCPSYNDGDELRRTLGDLSKLKLLQSVAIVPVGITKFRKDSKLVKVTPKKAKETIEIVDEFNEKMQKPLVSCSDEFYLFAKLPFPKSRYYNSYSQLEDGVGACRILLDDFYKRKLPKKISEPKKMMIFTGESAFSTMNIIAGEVNKIENVELQIIAVKSKFWGENITVTGLITGKDLLDTMKQTDLKDYFVMIPSVMLRDYTNEFLDGVTLSGLERALNKSVYVIQDCYSTKEIVDIIKQKQS